MSPSWLAWVQDWIQKRYGTVRVGQPPHDHWLGRVGATSLRAAAIFLAYALAYHSAGLFEVQVGVSAIFVPAALTTIVVMLLGLRWLPLIYVVLLGLGARGDFAGLSATDALEWLRHVVVYGLAGLYLGYAWPQPFRQFSLMTAIQFIGVAFVASFASALLMLATRLYGSLPDPVVGSAFLSFWGGDFAGLMIGVPLILLLRSLLLGLRHWDGPQIRSALANAKPLRFAQQGLFAASVAILAAGVPLALGVTTPMAILILFPVVMAGLLHGALVGLAVTGIACAAYLLAGKSLGADMGQPIEIQLVLAIAAALVLLAGAARDDRLREWQQANFDVLTKLPNRRMLMDRIEQAWRRAQRQGDRLAILFMDLDHFKAVNDSHGHDAGDQVLIQAARRIRACVRASDTVARLSGDEFVAVLSDVDDSDSSGVHRVAEDILAALQAPFWVEGHRLRVSGSIGIAVFPEDGDDPETLLRNADVALYRAKSAGRNRFRNFAPSDRIEIPIPFPALDA